MINYLEYCQKVLLLEETPAEVQTRMEKLITDPTERSVYKQIMDLQQSGQGKAGYLDILLKTRDERTRTGITAQEIIRVFQSLVALKAKNLGVNTAELAKIDRTNHPDPKESTLWHDLTIKVDDILARLRVKQDLKTKKATSVKVSAAVTGEEADDTEFPDPIFKDENIELYLNMSPGKINNVTHGAVCVAGPNYFSYRFNWSGTFYHLIPRTQELKKKYIKMPGSETDGEYWIQIELRDPGSAHQHSRPPIVWVNKRNREWQGGLQSIDELLRMFPELRPAVNAGKLKVVPVESGEQQIREKVQNELDDRRFSELNYNLKNAYISMGHELSDNQWSILDTFQKNAYLGMTLTFDVSPHQYEELKKTESLSKRYNVIKARALVRKIQSGEFAKGSVTNHEAAVLPAVLSTSNEDTKAKISTGLINSIKGVFNGTLEPRADLSGVYKLFKGTLLADPAMQDPQMIQSIATLLAGGRAQAWSSISDNIKKGIYDIAEDIYKSNAQVMKPLIDDAIRSNPSTLIKGLITTPTIFQAEYFDEYKDVLLKQKDFKKNLDNSILQNITYGTSMNWWMKGYWEKNKSTYLRNINFKESVKEDLRGILFGSHDQVKFPAYGALPPETKEIYDLYIDDLWKDPKTLEQVRETLYTGSMSKSFNIDVKDSPGVSSWPVSEAYKKYFDQHKEPLKEWLAYKIIDDPPEHMRDEIHALEEQYKDRIMANEVYRNLIEKNILRDFVYEKKRTFNWDGIRINHWLHDFWGILKRNPGAEQTLLQRVIEEFGMDNAANSWYSEYGLPYEFYQKYKNQILADPQAWRGLAERVYDTLRWRQPKTMPIPEALNRLSPTERDFYEQFKAGFTPQRIDDPSYEVKPEDRPEYEGRGQPARATRRR